MSAAKAFDVGEISEELARLRGHHHLRRVAFVLPLLPGTRDVARAFIAEEPPFDAEAVGIDSHEVLLTENEAIFVFGTPDGVDTLERILSDEEFWLLVKSWEKIAAGRPRIAEVAYSWAPAAT